MAEQHDDPTRRSFLAGSVRGAGLLAACGLAGLVVARRAPANTLWQIDPYKCMQCGKCASNCVLEPSAVKCVQVQILCGYCDLCTGYFEVNANALNTGAENQICPTGAIRRRFIEDPYYEYSIDESLCIACGKCVAGCAAFGNGSMFLQINQKLCVHCNQCTIASACPSQAVQRVSPDKPYILKDKPRTS
jgi:electron transport complex protein RnfB